MGSSIRRFFCIESENRPPPHPHPKAAEPSQHDLTIMNLKSLRDDLLNQRKRMNLSIEKTEQEIKGHLVKKNKEAAIFAIKRKKLFEEYLSTADNKYLFIQKAIIEVEKAIVDKDLNDVMKQTNSLLKDIQKSIDLEAMDEMKENFALVDEQKNAFNNLFSQYHVKEELDEEYDKYEAELEKKKFEELDKNPVIFKQNEGKMELEEEKPQGEQQKKDHGNSLEERLMDLA